jgi:hypothetical protein
MGRDRRLPRRFRGGTVTDTDVREYRDQVAEYRFSEFGTEASPTYPSARKAGASLLMAGLAAFGGLAGAGTSIGGNYGAIQSLAAVNRTDHGAFAAPVVAKPVPAVPRGLNAQSRSDRDEVAWIKAHSGLTWDQLGKIFGVSRRAVHMWANGGRLNESNARRLRTFAAIIHRLESERSGDATPEVLRARLLQIEPDGMSIVDRLRRDHSNGPTWGAPFGPERLVDAIREPLRTPVGEVEP